MAMDEGALRISLEALQPRLKRPGQQPVIGIQEHHVLALAVANPRVARPGEPLIFLPDQAHLWVAASNLRGVVGGAVVDHDDLEVGVALIQYALYRLA